MILIKERIGKLLEDIQELIYSEEIKIPSYRIRKVTEREKDEGNQDTSGWDVITSEGIWGGHREYFYLETEIEVPQELDGKCLVYEIRTGKEGEWDAINPQFLAYVNGKVKQGLDLNHRELVLTENAIAGEKFRILLSAFTGDHNFSIALDTKYKVLHREIEKYYYDLKVPYEVARLLNKDSDEHIRILKALNESLNLLDMREVYSDLFFESLNRAQEYITKEFYEKECGNSRHTIFCVGHTHIDVAWLWTLAVTEDKAVRSFSTVLENMRMYPEFKFMSSQPQLYKYVKKNAPEVYEEIKQRVEEGRWEVEGGMFVEPDCNLTSGESLVRQFLYGTRFFEEEFGKKNRILWLPDVFGYSAALPQIMKKSEIDYFMTSKISWNEFNKMPYDTFMWEGIDGTEVLTHFTPTRDYGTGAKEGSVETEHFTTYVGMLNPSHTMGNWQRYSQKDLNDETLMLYGWGDGGGGPTREMLENGRRLEKGIPGSPRTKQSHAQEFFETLEQNVEGSKYLPKWVGELYLEYHRGTYTSMARNKKFNRKAEFAYENLEFYGTLAKKLLGEAYPKKEIDDAWEVILRNQFHDILPGSSIKEVYENSKEEYEKIFDAGNKLTDNILQNLADAIKGNEGDIVVFNPNSVSGKAPIILTDLADEASVLYDEHGCYALQSTEEGKIAIIDQIPSKGFRKFAVGKEMASTAESAGLSVSKQSIDTPFFSIKIDENGWFESIFDKRADRELIPAGEKANVLMTYEDRPHNYDAWDINNYYTEKSWIVDDLTAMDVVEEGPVRGCIRMERKYLSSKIVQYLYFYADLPRIDIRNEIDWKENHVLLRDNIPVDIHSSEATYDIQFGNVKRPTHYNTSWDFARFEVCAHKWIDYSEEGYGVSILNDCKYGYSVHDKVIGLSMLKSATYPNEAADKEHHTFWYSICPHEGSFKEAGTIENAYLFNNPYKVVKKEKNGEILDTSYSFADVDADNVIVEVVKEAVNGEQLIVRVYECHNRRTNAKLKLGEKIRNAVECNLLERQDTAVDFQDDFINFMIKPYEIKTFKIELEK